jgi:hypothetical protein
MRICKKCGALATTKSRALLCDTHERERIKHAATRRRQREPNHGRNYRAANRERMSELEKKRRRANVVKTLLHGAKHRAKKYGLPFSLTVNNVHLPTHCPLLGIELGTRTGKLGASSPSLDRIFNDRGYVPDNVLIISHAANTCKGGLRADDILKIGMNLKFIETFRAKI